MKTQSQGQTNDQNLLPGREMSVNGFTITPEILEKLRALATQTNPREMCRVFRDQLVAVAAHKAAIENSPEKVPSYVADFVVPQEWYLYTSMVMDLLDALPPIKDEKN